MKEANHISVRYFQILTTLSIGLTVMGIDYNTRKIYRITQTL